MPCCGVGEHAGKYWEAEGEGKMWTRAFIVVSVGRNELSKTG